MAALPAMLGSGLLLLVLFGWMGPWEGLVLFAWVATGAAAVPPVGERLAVSLGCGFRRPSDAEQTALGPVWASALARAGVGPGDVDLYVQAGKVVNAYAAGGRSVALTDCVITEFLARRLGSGELEAVLVHELGHHATRGGRGALVSAWLAAPWRWMSRAALYALWAVMRRQPSRMVVALTVATVVVAVLQTVQARQSFVAGVLVVVAVCAVVCPLLDAYVSRRCEYAADRFAAQRGLGPQLSAALTQIQQASTPRRAVAHGALNRHARLEKRVAALRRPSAGN